MAGWQAGLNELTARVLIPAFLFSGASQHGIPAAVSWQFLAAFFVPLLVLFIAVAWSARRTADGAARALAATYSNTVFVGLPVLVQAFGSASLQYAFPVIAFHGLIAFTLYYLAVPAHGANKLTGALLATASNPVVLSLMLGLALGAAGWRLPQPAERALALLSGAALPCALLALGASLAVFHVRSYATTSLIVLVKLVALPAGVLAMTRLLGVPPAAGAVQADGANPAAVSSAILLSSVLCVVTLPLWLMLHAL